MPYELREQHVIPKDCEPYGLWHIVEIGRLLALCGHAVDAAAGRGRLRTWARSTPDCRCDPCEQIHRGAAGGSLKGDWHKEALDQGRRSSA